MMYQLKRLFNHGLPFGLQIPPYIRQEFLGEAVRKNDLSLWIICAIIFGVELFNIARVLFWSQAGLGTRNNRIYFALYWILILLGVLWLVLRRLLRRAPTTLQWAAQYGTTALIFLWHLALNTYDLYRDPAAGITVLTTAVLGLALLIQSPPCYSVAQFGVGYLLFRAIMAPLLETGDRINLTITFVVALTVSLSHAHHTVVVLRQQKRIVEINAKLQQLVQMDSMTGLLNKTAVEGRAQQVLQSLEHTETGEGLTLFLVDLDEFKNINDHYGHPCGDRVLMETAEAMRRTFPDAAALGRVGGDEFAVLYDRSLTEPQAVDLSRRLMKRLGNILWQGQPLKVGCSVGVCVCPLPRYSYQQLYTQTDRMLYHAKETGRGQCCFERLEHEDDRRLEAAQE